MHFLAVTRMPEIDQFSRTLSREYLALPRAISRAVKQLANEIMQVDRKNRRRCCRKIYIYIYIYHIAMCFSLSPSFLFIRPGCMVRRSRRSLLSLVHANRNRYVRASVERSSHNHNREATTNVLSVIPDLGIESA